MHHRSANYGGLKRCPPRVVSRVQSRTLFSPRGPASLSRVIMRSFVDRRFKWKRIIPLNSPAGNNNAAQTLFAGASGNDESTGMKNCRELSLIFLRDLLSRFSGLALRRAFLGEIKESPGFFSVEWRTISVLYFPVFPRISASVFWSIPESAACRRIFE